VKLPSKPPQDNLQINSRALINLANVKPEQVDWLWDGRIPLRKLTILDGDPGRGKTSVLLDVAARLSIGAPMPSSVACIDPVDTLLLPTEDGLGDTIRPRLDVAGADVRRIHALVGHDEDPTRPITFPRDELYLEAAILKTNSRLVGIDPLMGFLDKGINPNSDPDVRRALLALSQVAERTGAAIVAVRHFNKKSDAAAMYRGSGSIAFTATARSVLVVADDPKDPAVRVLASLKCNIAVPTPSLCFRLESGAQAIPFVVWLGETDRSARDLLSAPFTSGRSDRDSCLAAAIQFLRRTLVGSPRAQTEIEEMAKAEGISMSTLMRAKKDLGVRSKKVGNAWTWALPSTESSPRPCSSEVRAQASSGPQGSTDAQRCPPDAGADGALGALGDVGDLESLERDEGDSE
jgi:hypothetical protein